MVRRMLSSIFLNLLVLTTCFIRWSRFYIFSYGVGNGEERNKEGAEGEELSLGDGDRGFVFIEFSLVVEFIDFCSLMK